MHFYGAGDIYSLCGILHVKTSSVISVSTWRLVSYEYCRYILLYAALTGLRPRSERSQHLHVMQPLKANSE